MNEAAKRQASRNSIIAPPSNKTILVDASAQSPAASALIIEAGASRTCSQAAPNIELANDHDNSRASSCISMNCSIVNNCMISPYGFLGSNNNSH